VKGGGKGKDLRRKERKREEGLKGRERGS